MNVVTNGKNLILIDLVKPGEVFVYNHNYYLRVIYDSDYPSKINCVNLETGKLYSYDLVTTVKKVDAKVVVECG